MARNPLSRAAVAIGGAYLQLLREAGFEERRAAQIVRVVSAYANGRTEMGAHRLRADAQLAQPATEAGLLLRLGRMLPADMPAHLLDATVTLYADIDADADFELGLDLLIRGLRSGGARTD